MSWQPNDKEMAVVLSLDAPLRYGHWIKKVADQEEVWSLWNEEGWALAGDDSGHEMVPVWPHSRYAELCAKGVWAGCRAKSIPLDVWLDRWIPGMVRDQLLVSVFPTPGGKGICVEPKRLEQDLRNELSNYE